MHFKPTAFYAPGFLEIFKVVSTLKSLLFSGVILMNSLAKHACEKTSYACFA